MRNCHLAIAFPPCKVTKYCGVCPLFNELHLVCDKAFYSSLFLCVMALQIANSFILDRATQTQRMGFTFILLSVLVKIDIYLSKYFPVQPHFQCSVVRFTS